MAAVAKNEDDKPPESQKRPKPKTQTVGIPIETLTEGGNVVTILLPLEDIEGDVFFVPGSSESN